MQRAQSENNGRFGEPGWGFRLGGLAVQLPGAGGNQSKGQECSQGFWASGLYYAKGTRCQGRGSMGRESSWSLRFGQVKRESSWAGRVGGTVSGSRSLRWKVPVTAWQSGPDPARLSTGLLDPPQQFRG